MGPGSPESTSEEGTPETYRETPIQVRSCLSLKSPKAARITRRQDIESIQREGRTLRVAALVVRMRPSPFASGRVGVVVPRFGHTAVLRNRLKRRLRSLTRSQLGQAGVGQDVIVWAKAPAYRLTFSALQSALDQLTQRMLTATTGK
jgi:ribonuclease P protein component